MARAPQTLFEKVWERTRSSPETADTPAVLYIDLHLVHEVTSPQAFARAARARPAGAPPRSHARDHGSLHARRAPSRSSAACRSRSSPPRSRCAQLEKNCERVRRRAVRPAATRSAASCTSSVRSSGITQPGKTIVCGDSHTSTHGAFGALAFGIGTTEVGHVLATQCLLQRKPKTFAINVEGALAAGRHGQGPDPRHHRPDRRRRRHRPRARVPRRRRSARSPWKSA